MDILDLRKSGRGRRGVGAKHGDLKYTPAGLGQWHLSMTLFDPW